MANSGRGSAQHVFGVVGVQLCGGDEPCEDLGVLWGLVGFEGGVDLIVPRTAVGLCTPAAGTGQRITDYICGLFT